MNKYHSGGKFTAVLELHIAMNDKYNSILAVKGLLSYGHSRKNNIHNDKFSSNLYVSVWCLHYKINSDLKMNAHVRSDELNFPMYRKNSGNVTSRLPLTILHHS